MIAWNAPDWEIIMEANKYRLPVVRVALGWQTSRWQPDTAEVTYLPRGVPKVRRYIRLPYPLREELSGDVK